MSVSKVFDDLDPILDQQGGLKNPDSAVEELIRYRTLNITVTTFYKIKHTVPLQSIPPHFEIDQKRAKLSTEKWKK